MTPTLTSSNGSHPPSEVIGARGEVDARTLSTNRGTRQVEIPALPKFFLRQILGLNPFRTSYFSLYRPLKDFRSRSIITLGTLCAISAGVPLPIIGIIFGKLIDGFPPNEDELAMRL